MKYAPLVDGPEAAIASALRGDVNGLEVATSGSSGRPRRVLVPSTALIASAEATHRRLAGPGRWLLALPADHIAGAQVLVRSSLAGNLPVYLPQGSFTPESFLAAASVLFSTTDEGVPLYTSLVPTQLRRLAASPEAWAALERFSAVLVGGAPLGGFPTPLPSTVVETYGATETAGGCVYDGLPLDGVRISVDGDGRVSVGGDVVADGYADDGDYGDDAFGTQDGFRWYRTPDLGKWDEEALTILGRADDVIVTGGHKVHPAEVERALLSLPGIDQAVVVGVPDSEWGERVTALIVPSEGSRMDASDIRAALAGLPEHAIPREVRAVSTLPLKKNGKIDRTAIRLIV